MKRKEEKNPYCPVPGRTTKPHLDDSATAGIQKMFSKPEAVAEWVKSCIVELVDTLNNSAHASLA